MTTTGSPESERSVVVRSRDGVVLGTGAALIVIAVLMFVLQMHIGAHP